MSIERSNRVLIPLKAAYHANTGAARHFAGPSSQIHHLTIVYCFEHTNHDIQIKSLFQNLCKLFLHAHNLHQ